MDPGSAHYGLPAQAEALGLNLLEVRRVETQAKPREQRNFRSP
jgi:hypothetical protein